MHSIAMIWHPSIVNSIGLNNYLTVKCYKGNYFPFAMFLIVIFHVVCVGLCQGILISSNKPTVQSSLWPEFVSSNCVDGKYDTVCRTLLDYPSSWRVDLQGTFSISHVVLHNRADCCQEKIIGLVVELLSKHDEVLHECGTIREVKSNIRIRCFNVVASKVRVRQSETQYFQLAEVEVHGEPAPSTADIVSRGKPTTQSTTFMGLNSSLAVDGKYDNYIKKDNIVHPNCFHTNEKEIGFWMVDLQERFLIERVVIYNRVDCCSDLMIGAVVELLDQNGEMVHECEQITESKPIYNIACGSKSAHKVRIRGTSYQSLHLCEVDVFKGSDVVLISRGKPTTLSSIENSLDGSLAVDGNYRTFTSTPFIALAQCFHTQCNGNEWWIVDLKETFNIDHVVLYNRMEQYSWAARILGSTVELLSATDETIHECGKTNEVKAIYNISCGQKSAQKVRVKGSETECLHLCEVDVYGGQTIPTLLSRGKATTMSSVYENLTSELGVDGNYENIMSVPSKTYRNCFQTHNEMGYWMVDLQGTFIIDHVILYNRMDCCSENIIGVKVEILSDSNTVIHECGQITETNATYKIGCGRTKGQKLQLKATQTNPLHVCEVDVFGMIAD